MKRTFFFELDTGGSWRPRSNHVGAIRRWIIGPVSFGYISGNLNQLFRAVLACVKDGTIT